MIHRALHLIRKYHHMTQAQLAGEVLGISNSYLSEIEGGSKDPGYELLQKYAEFFKMPLSSIMLFAETVESGKPLQKGEKIRVACAPKILRILEWMDDTTEWHGIFTGAK